MKLQPKYDVGERVYATGPEMNGEIVVIHISKGLITYDVRLDNIGSPLLLLEKALDKPRLVLTTNKETTDLVCAAETWVRQIMTKKSVMTMPEVIAEWEANKMGKTIYTREVG